MNQEPVAWKHGDYIYNHPAHDMNFLQAEAIPLYSIPPNLPAMIEQARKEESDRIGKLIHYPECWDTAAYPTLESALAEIHFCSQCYDNRTDAIRARKP